MHIIPLHLHSQWSLLDGLATIPELVDFAHSCELPALALTDSNALYGAIEFTAHCQDSGIQPIVGAELALSGGHLILLLAQRSAGYANLCRLISRLQATPDREASLARGLSKEELGAHAEGLIALSGGPAGLLDAALREGDTARAERAALELVNLFGRECFFIELQIHRQEDVENVKALQTLADRLHLQTVATHDIHYLSADDARRYRVLSAMRLGRLAADLPLQPELAFPSSDEMRRKFAGFPDALANTRQIADRCRLDLPLGQLHFPMPVLPEGRSPHEALWAQALRGAETRYGALTPELDARLRKEVDVIDTLGYTPYFLVVADIVRFARERQIPISPRGSASSSVVAYSIGIHDIDPIEHNLYFERFLSLERRDPPDIDLDLCSRRRDEVVHYVYETYGAEHTAMVCTYATLRARYALREVGKAYGLPEKRIDELSSHLPWRWNPGRADENEAALAKLMHQARDSLEREVIEMSRALDGVPHHLSVHPGGIVISAQPITNLVPLQYATKGLVITQYDLNSVARLGLVKIDLLGISALTVVADCVDLIRKRQPDFSLESIPPGDEATSNTLSAAQTIGCFQIESPGMRLTLREVAARDAGDILIALALFRPGPLTGGLKDAFVRRHLGQEPASYLHPALEPILRETHGVILYQEQVLRIAHEVAGFTLGEADRLRRAMSKKSEREMARLREQFVAGARDVSGFDEATAIRVWDLMAAFAGYGFPKAHAAGYAAIAYRMAYLKTHHPAEFMAARLGVAGGFYSPRVYMSEARRLGMVVRPPHINHSDEAFSLDPVDRTTLWMGLGQVRELTHATIAAILKQRPFNSLDEFLRRAHPAHTEAVNLVKAGALDGLGSAKTMLHRLEEERWRGRHTAQLSFTLEMAEHSTEAELSLAERAAWEQESLGMPVSVHPLQLAREELKSYRLTRSSELSACIGKEVTLAGFGLAAHRFTARQKDAMLLIDLEDEAGVYQTLWSGEALREHRRLFVRRGMLLIQGKVQLDRQGRIIVVGRSAARIGENEAGD